MTERLFSTDGEEKAEEEEEDEVDEDVSGQPWVIKELNIYGDEK